MINSDNQPLAVVCAADDRYAMPLAVVLRSAIENLSSERQIVFFVIDGGIKPRNKDRIISSTKINNSRRCQIKWLHPSKDILIEMKVTERITVAAYFRLLIPTMLPDNFSKAIYLDSDLLVQGDLAKLWDMDLADNYLLAVQGLGVSYVSSPYGLTNYRELGIPADCKYFNSGVMVMNLAKWRTDNISQTIIEYLQKNQQYVRWWDQDGLNAVLAGQWGELEPRWNQTPGFHKRSWQDSPFSQEDFHNAVRDPYIVHFASAEKPWNSVKTRKIPTTDLFFQYVDMTAWNGWRFNFLRRVRKTLRYKIKQLSKSLLPFKPAA